MNDSLKVKINHKLEVNGIDLQLFADGESTAADDFLKSNKKVTTDYRVALARAIGETGTLPKITQMAFGVAGEVDEQGNPLPPGDNGPLNEVLLTKDITTVSFPVPTTVCFEARIEMGDATAAINEVALIDADGGTAARIRLLTSKGIDAESGLIFKWYVEF